jgi:uncharacterized protein (TIRG00374 family)
MTDRRNVRDAGGENVRPIRGMAHNGRLGLGILLSIVCLVLAFRGVDLGDVVTILRNTTPGWLGVVILSVLLTALAKTARWRLLLSADGSRIPAPKTAHPSSLGFWRLTNIWMAGAALNLALPAPRSGDLARVYLVGEATTTSKSLVLGTVAAEKLLDVIMLALVFLALVPFMALPTELAVRQGSVVGVALAMLAVVSLVLWQRDTLLSGLRRGLTRLPDHWSGRLIGSLERAVGGLDALRSPRTIFWLALWSIAIWFLSAYTNYATFLAMGIQPSWIQSFFLLVVLHVGVALPSSPGKIGVFQVLCRWALGIFGLSATLGLTYGVLLYLCAPVLLMILGAVALARESWWLRQKPNSLGSFLSQGDQTGQELEI